MDDSRWLALTWNAAGGRRGRSFDLWDDPVAKFGMSGQVRRARLWRARGQTGEHLKIVQYVAVLGDSPWLKEALVWNAEGGKLGRSFNLWDAPVRKF